MKRNEHCKTHPVTLIIKLRGNDRFCSFWVAKLEQTQPTEAIISVILDTYLVVLFAPVLPLQSNAFRVSDTGSHSENIVCTLTECKDYVRMVLDHNNSACASGMRPIVSERI